MSKLSELFLTTAITLVLVTEAFSQSQGSSPTPPDTSNPAREVLRSVVKSCNDFGFKLFRAVAAQKAQRDNVLVSPLSAYVALAMAYNGAAGATRDSIAKAMEVAGLPDSLFNEAIGTLVTRLVQADTAVTIDIANSLWYHETTGITKTFVDLCQNHFSAEVRRANFHTQAAVDSINGWIQLVTREHITSIVDRLTLENAKALLVNGLCFEGDWTFPFDSTKTRPDKFHMPGDSVMDCYMMYRSTEEDAQLFRKFYGHRPLTYFENKLFQGVNLGYGSRGLLMTVLLPDSLSSIEALVAQLSEGNWRAWQQIPTGGSFYLGLPKFRFECETPLKQALDSLGMGIMFAENADFSNMFSDSIGTVSDVRQKTYVEVSEKGTKAAAATVIMYADSVPPSLIANRPFLFLIHDRETGLILFIGKVAKPKW